MNRLTEKIDNLIAADRKILSMFVTAGYPTLDSTTEIVLTLEQAGADVIELGVPFSDPLADGPVIQHSSQVALQNGVTVDRVFEVVQSIRKQSPIPLVLMGYANPIFSYGIERFLKSAADVGVDGCIIADLPVEEAGEYRALANLNKLSTIFLVAPTTPPEKIRLIDETSSGFVYCVSMTGVTGMNNGIQENIREFLRTVKVYVNENPVLVGFGILKKEDVKIIAPYVNGIIVGSALIDIIERNSNENYFEMIYSFTSDFRKSLDSVIRKISS